MKIKKLFILAAAAAVLSVFSVNLMQAKADTLDGVPPNLNVSESTTQYVEDKVSLNVTSSDNYNIVKTIKVVGPGINQTINQFSKPKILCIYTASDTNHVVLDYIKNQGYDVTVNTNITDVSQLKDYDVIFADAACWKIASSNTASILNQAYDEGYKVLTFGNDNNVGCHLHPITKSNGVANGYYNLVKSSQNDTPYSSVEHIMESYDGQAESDSSRCSITAWPSDTKPIAMDSTNPSAALVTESINNNQGKWINCNLVSPHGLFTNRILDELMWGTDATRQNYSQSVDVTQNGVYTVTAEDFSGNVTTKSVVVSNIRETSMNVLEPQKGHINPLMNNPIIVKIPVTVNSNTNYSLLAKAASDFVGKKYTIPVSSVFLQIEGSTTKIPLSQTDTVLEDNLSQGTKNYVIDVIVDDKWQYKPDSYSVPVMITAKQKY